MATDVENRKKWETENPNTGIPGLSQYAGLDFSNPPPQVTSEGVPVAPGTTYLGQGMVPGTGGGVTSTVPPTTPAAASTTPSAGGGFGGAASLTSGGGALAGLQAASPDMTPAAEMLQAAPGSLRQNLGRRNLPNELSGLRVLTY